MFLYPLNYKKIHTHRWSDHAQLAHNDNKVPNQTGSTLAAKATDAA
jgi:hypothetical protein